MSEFGTCPKCGRTLRSTRPYSPNQSRGECRVHGDVTVRWLGGKGCPRGANATWAADLPPRSS